MDINTGTYETHTVRIRDGRLIQDRFSLDTHGFALLKDASAVTDFSDKSQIDALYAKEAERVILKLTGADRYVPSSWIMRGSDAIPGGPIQQPAGEAHVDISHDRAQLRASGVYAKAFPGGPGFSRFIALSYWRCLSPPPQDWPLALCESTSVADDEGIPNTMYVVDKMPDEQARLAALADEDKAPAASIFFFSPAHRWWYFPDMTPDEVLVFKFHDSDHSRAWRHIGASARSIMRR